MQLFTPPTPEVPGIMQSCWPRKPDFRHIPLQKRKTGLCWCGGCLSWLDHGRFGQGLCRGCEALSGVRCLRRRHGTNRNTDRQRAEKSGIPANIPLFTLQGNFNVKKLHGIYRFMMEIMVKTVGKGLAAKKDCTPEEDDMLDMMLHGGERVKVENLSAVLDWYRAQQ